MQILDLPLPREARFDLREVVVRTVRRFEEQPYQSLMRQLARNVRLVFDYLPMTENSRSRRGQRVAGC